MYHKYGDRAAFLFVYVSEAHPSDGWQMPVNVRDNVVFAQPRTADQRHDVASQCCSKLRLTMPCVVDSIDNRADNLYAGWPERLFVIDATGKIAYAGGQGPFGFEPDDIEKWLRKNVGGPRQP